SFRMVPRAPSPRWWSSTICGSGWVCLNARRPIWRRSSARCEQLRDIHRSTARTLFTECTEPPVEPRGIIPERGMTCVWHDVNLRVRQAGAVLRHDLRPDDRVERAMCDQYRLHDGW